MLFPSDSTVDMPDISVLQTFSISENFWPPLVPTTQVPSLLPTSIIIMKKFFNEHYCYMPSPLMLNSAALISSGMFNVQVADII